MVDVEVKDVMVKVVVEIMGATMDMVGAALDGAYVLATTYKVQDSAQEIYTAHTIKAVKSVTNKTHV